MMDAIQFTLDDGTTVEFYVVEQAKLVGVNCLLVADSEEEDGTALILRDMSEDKDKESRYEIVEDDQELAAVEVLFKSLLEDIDLVSDSDSEEDEADLIEE